jgi:AcrR family transcriptional regulator
MSSADEVASAEVQPAANEKGIPMAKGLTRETLVRTALAIVDAEGLDALSMRRLGAELDVDPMAAYRHLPNKDALLDGLMEAVVAEVDLDVDEGLPWREQLRALVDAQLETLLAHPNVLPLLAQRPLTTAASLYVVERALDVMATAGIPRHESVLAVNVMGLLTNSLAVAMGASARDPRSSEELQDIFAELPADEFPNILATVTDGQFIESYDQILEFWLRALLDRLEHLAAVDPDGNPAHLD